MEEKVRKDLGKIVKKIGLKLEEGRFNDKSICTAELFNDQKVRFLDKENKVYNVLKVYKDMGYDLTKVIKSRTLVEREKKAGVEIDGDVCDENAGTYVAISYVLEDEHEYLLFPERACDYTLINLCYKKFKEEQNAQKKSSKIGEIYAK